MDCAHNIPLISIASFFSPPQYVSTLLLPLSFFLGYLMGGGKKVSEWIWMCLAVPDWLAVPASGSQDFLDPLLSSRPWYRHIAWVSPRVQNKQAYLLSTLLPFLTDEFKLIKINNLIPLPNLIVSHYFSIDWPHSAIHPSYQHKQHSLIRQSQDICCRQEPSLERYYLWSHCVWLRSFVAVFVCTTKKKKRNRQHELGRSCRSCACGLGMYVLVRVSHKFSQKTKSKL